MSTDRDVLVRFLMNTWTFVLGVAGSIILANFLARWLTGDVRDGIVYTSWALQVLGGIAIVYGLTSTERFFDVRSLIAMLKSRLRRLFRRKRVIHAQFSGAVSLSATVSGSGTVTAGEGASMEQRLKRLELDVKSLQETVAQLNTKMREEARKAQAGIGDEAAERRAADAELAGKLKKAMVGSIHLEYRGVGWILIGVTLGAFATPLTPVLDWMYPCL